MNENIDIITVKERIQLLRAMYCRYKIFTQETFMESMNAWKVKVQLLVYVDGEWDETQGTSIRKVDETDEFGRHALEWAETKAIGRAIAARGIGIKGSYASKEEIEDARLDIQSPIVFGEEEATKKDVKMKKVAFDVNKEIAKNGVDHVDQRLYSREELVEVDNMKDLLVICKDIGVDLSEIKGRRSQKQVRDLIMTSQNKEIKAILDKEFPAGEADKESALPDATPDNSLEEKFKKDMASKGIDTISVSDDKPAVKTEKMDDGDDQEIPFEGGGLNENFEDTGNRYGIEIPELPESGERDYNSVVAVIYNKLIVKGTVKMVQLEKVIDDLGFRSNYKGFGHMLSNATKEEVNQVLNKI